MSKNFNDWNILKQKLNSDPEEIYAYPREVWWCAIGTNIGLEIDGKNENFERPVLILRAYNKEALLAVPMTTQKKEKSYHYKIKSNLRDVVIVLNQIRFISNKRLIRKIGVIPQDEFFSIVKAVKEFV